MQRRRRRKSEQGGAAGATKVKQTPATAGCAEFAARGLKWVCSRVPKVGISSRVSLRDHSTSVSRSFVCTITSGVEERSLSNAIDVAIQPRWYNPKWVLSGFKPVRADPAQPVVNNTQHQSKSSQTKPHRAMPLYAVRGLHMRSAACIYICGPRTAYMSSSRFKLQ
eukprot:gene22541-biopygen13283